MVFHAKTKSESKGYAIYLYKEQKLSIRKISAKVVLSKSSVHRLVKSKARIHDDVAKTTHKSKHAGGKSPILHPRQKRTILRNLLSLREKCGNFTSKRLMKRLISRHKVSDRTIRHFVK